MIAPIAVIESRSAIENLEASIKERCRAINALTYELLVDIRHFDQRAGFLKWGLSTTAEWLHGHCNIHIATAREKVRAAHALAQLPLVSNAFARGELSWCKVRSLTRVAGPDNEAELVTFAKRHTSGQVQDRCKELRYGTPSSASEAYSAYERRSLWISRNAERGTMTITVELPVEQGDLIDKALDKARDDSGSEGPELRDESWSARQADAFVEMARRFLIGAGDSECAGNGSDNYLVTVHVDQQALAEGKGKAGLPLESVKRLCCDGQTVTLVENAQGEPLNIGRKSRTIPGAIKRALWSRDRHCRFPGCTHKRFCDGHHIDHWSNGGETSLENLILLCDKHHRLVHEGGFRIDKNYQDRWTFYRPDGIAVPHVGYHVSDVYDETAEEGLDDASRDAFAKEERRLAVNLLHRQFRGRKRKQISVR